MSVRWPTHGTGSWSVIDPKSFPHTLSNERTSSIQVQCGLTQKGLTQKSLPPLSFVKINKIPNHVIICMYLIVLCW